MVGLVTPDMVDMIDGRQGYAIVVSHRVGRRELWDSPTLPRWSRVPAPVPVPGAIFGRPERRAASTCSACSLPQLVQTLIVNLIPRLQLH